MKLGDLKIEALKLMFAGYGDEIVPETLDRFKGDENYKNYLVSMPGAINRCFSILENKKVLPLRSVTVIREDCEEKYGRLHVDLSLIAPDLHAIERVIVDGWEAGYEGSAEFSLEGPVLVLKIPEAEETELRLLYRPKLERISAISNDSMVLNIPDDIACHIPYYIKADLFREDEPEEASLARTLFDMAMEELKRNEPAEKMQRRVENRMGEWLM